MSRQCRGLVALLCGFAATADGSILRSARGSGQMQRLARFRTQAMQNPFAAPAPALQISPAAAPAPAWPVYMAPQNSVLASSSQCASVKTCGTCTALENCGWCPVEQKCVEGSKHGPVKEQCLAYDFMHCTNVPCDGRNTCADCLADKTCGWCASMGKCAKGDSKGPLAASSCPPAPGFIGAPSWAHAFSERKCANVAAPPAPELWDNLRGLMYRWQGRIARLESSGVESRQPQPQPQPQPGITPVLPPTLGAPPAAAPPAVVGGTPFPQAAMPPPFWVATTGVPTTTTEKTTTTPAPTTPCPKPSEPPIKIKVNVDQRVENSATGEQKKGIAPAPSTMMSLAPAPASESKKDKKAGKKKGKKKGVEIETPKVESPVR